tara:strand:+ start:512 stop:637 length:126 start_codon:yes stop_codon:yes gene_type:complete
VTVAEKMHENVQMTQKRTFAATVAEKVKFTLILRQNLHFCL